MDAKKFWVVQVNFDPSKLPSYSIQIFPSASTLSVILLEANQKACATKITIGKPKHVVVLRYVLKPWCIWSVFHYLAFKGGFTLQDSQIRRASRGRGSQRKEVDVRWQQ